MGSIPEEATENFSVHYVLGAGAGDVKQVPPEQRGLQGASRTPFGVTRDLYSSLLYIFAFFRKSSKAVNADYTPLRFIFLQCFGFRSSKILYVALNYWLHKS